MLGTICLMFCFFFFDKNYTFFQINLKLDTPRNYLVYTLIISIPFSLYYLHHFFKKKGVLMGSMLFMLMILLTDGRAGAIIVAIQLLLILGIVYPNVKRLSTLVIAGGALLLSLFPVNIEEAAERFGRNISDVSPRISNLILEQGDGDLSMDKSWLIRELMVSKGLEISGKYALIGIGPNNFSNYRAEINSYSEVQRLSGHSKSFYNELSAHNSYIQVLAEFGLLGFSLFVLTIVSINLFFIKNIFGSKITMNFVPVISLFGASIQFYVISSITGAISWFIIAVAWMMYKTKNSNFIRPLNE
jgi:O-antigen ligase